MKVLVIDVGNTRVHLGRYDGRRVISVRSLPARMFRLPGSFCRGRWDAVLLASVNPVAERDVAREVNARLGLRPMRLGRDISLPIKARYWAGIDRLANAVGAKMRLKRKGIRRPCVVIDLGTAITFDVLSARGEFLGGAIAPGMESAARALAGNCGLLPHVGVRRPGRTIGHNTVENIRSGIYWGTVGLIREQLGRIAGELGCRPYVIGTGGSAGLLKREGLADEIVPALTLEGIAHCCPIR
ncbi:MAG: hypothetical protein A2Z34_09005 [Planctomycetes bacterium RBG_16_59_8]|nr:MAG: hypothetical protein A2Z34_09005 [Planctomycetes bacterium RBG_16_59_8]